MPRHFFSTLLAVTLIFSTFLPLLKPSKAAAAVNIQCANNSFREWIRNVTFPQRQAMEDSFDVVVDFDVDKVERSPNNATYHILIAQDVAGGVARRSNNHTFPAVGLPAESRITFNVPSTDKIDRNYIVKLVREAPSEPFICRLGTMEIFDSTLENVSCSITPPANVQNGQPFNIIVSAAPESPIIEYRLYIMPTSENYPKNQVFSGLINTADILYRRDFNAPGGILTIPNNGVGADRRLDNGNYTILINARRTTNADHIIKCNTLLKVSNEPTSTPDQCTVMPQNPRTTGEVRLQIIGATPLVNYSSYLTFGGVPRETTDTKTTDGAGNASLGLGNGLAAGTYTVTAFNASGDTFCEKQFQVGGASTGGTGCVDCTTAGGDFCDPGKTQLKTAIGCLPIDTNGLLQNIVKLFIGMSGGVALLLMILGAVQMITSQGNPESLKGGRDRFTSAAIGLLFIILSVTILEIIGVDILSLPGFGR